MAQYEDQCRDVKAIEYPKGNWKKPKHCSVETPLFEALKTKDLALAKLLLDHGADPNTPDLYGRPPLVYAEEWMGEKGIKMAELLFQYDAHVNVVDKEGMTPLGYVVKYHPPNNSKDDFVKLLLANGADPNYKG